ncbi:MAG: hypothetical protein ACREIC_19350 [Limisphaerales bacterium]
MQLMKGVMMMKKIMAITALAGLLAAVTACSSKSSQGGTSDNQSYTNPSDTGNGSSMGNQGSSQESTNSSQLSNPSSNPSGSQVNPNGTGTENNGSGAGTTPGGSSSGLGNQNTPPQNPIPPASTDTNLNNTTPDNGAGQNAPPPAPPQ